MAPQMNGHGSVMPPPPPANLAPPPPPFDSRLPPPPPPSNSLPPPPPSDNLPPPPKAPTQTGAEVRDPFAAKPKAAPRPSTTPLKIEELMAKRKEAALAAGKPKFLSKAEREKQAMEKRAREVQEQQAKKERDMQAARESVSTVSTNGHSNKDIRGPSRQNGYANDSHPSHDRANAGRANGAASEAKNAKVVQSAEDVLRERYMGPQSKQSTFSAKNKRKRTAEKRFNFDWGNDDDTLQNDDLHGQSTQVNFFGKGRLGGYDDETTQSAAKRYAAALRDRDQEAGSMRAEAMIEMGRRQREEGGRMAIDKHWSEKRLEQMRERDWRIFKEDFSISAKGGGIPNPLRSWTESKLPSELLKVIDMVGYTDPSPIQRAAIPIALQARDLIGVAVTGSGKTAAFLLPLLVYIQGLPQLDDLTKNDGPYAIVLAPTRELAQQIEVEAKKFATPLGFRCVSIVGGHSLEVQSQQLAQGAEIVIATPGRLVDCLERRLLLLDQCCYVIMDEADRMIDLGFEEPVNKILDRLPVQNMKPDSDAAEDSYSMSQSLGGVLRYRQTMMYTATMPAAVERIAKNYLRRPAIVTIGNVGEAVETVEQRVEFVSGEDKRKKRMGEILSSREFGPPIIVFVNIKRNCDAVAKDIRGMGFTAVTLHGSKTQDQREAALLSVRNGQTQVLVATDLAGRGIDVPDVSLVLNFNMATSIESYTHRIGRTGRAGKSGVAITFLGAEDNDVLYDLKQLLTKSEISKVPEELRRHEAAQQKRTRGGDAKKPIE